MPRTSVALLIATLWTVTACSGGRSADENLPVDPPMQGPGNPVDPTDPTDPTEPAEPIALQSCTVVDVINTGSGTQKITVDLAPGERLVLDEMPRGAVLGFDETLGELQYEPPAGRHPDFFTYQILAADDSVVATGRRDIRLDPMRIMPLGDSITHGVEIYNGSTDFPPVPMRVGYRKALLEHLDAAGYAVDFTGQSGQRAGADAGITDEDNGGYPGVDISFIDGKLIEVLTERPSDVLLLHIGTNQTPTEADGIDAILDTLEQWEAANHPVTVFVATIIPKRDPGQQLQVDAFNSDVRNRIAAREMNDRVFLVEQADAVTVDDFDEADIGLHPTAAGYVRMADAWFDAMALTDVLIDCP